MPKTLTRIKTWSLTLIGLLLVVAVLYAGMYPVLTHSEMATGADTGSFLFVAKYTADYLKTNHRLPNILPHWYNGFEALHNAPILVYAPLVVLYLWLKDILLVSRVFHVLIIIFLGLSMFILLRSRTSTLSAVAGALLFASTPIVVFQVNGAGSYARVLSLAFLPLVFLFLNKMLENANRRWLYLGLTAIFFSLSLAAHPMVGLTMLIFLSIYVVVRIAIDPEIPSVVLFHWIGAVAFGFLLTAWYLVPYFAEQIAWVTIPEEVYRTSSIAPSAMLRWLGLIVLLLSALGVILLRRHRAVIALFLTGVVATVLSTGYYFPANPLLLVRSIYPFIALLMAAFAFAYIAGQAIDLQKMLPSKSTLLKIVSLAGTLVLVTIVAFLSFKTTYAETAAWKHSTKSFFSEPEIQLAKSLRKLPNSGRVMPMKYPFGYLLWWLMTEGNKPMVEGWYYSLTPTGKHIAWIYDAIDDGYPDYATNKLEHMNVRYLLTNPNFEAEGRRYQTFLRKMKDRGYAKTIDAGIFFVYQNSQKDKYVQSVTEPTLVVGKYSSRVAPLVGPSIEGGSARLDDYDMSVLQHFNTLALQGFSYNNQTSALDLLNRFLEKDGTVVVDLMGMKGAAVEEQPSFVGVSSVSLDIEKGKVEFEPAAKSPLLNGVDLSLLSSSFSNKAWKSSACFGLDKVILRLKYKGKSYDVLGYKQFEKGRVYFLGGNLFYNVYLTRNKAGLKLIQNLTATTGRNQPTAQISEEKLSPEYYRFSYNSKDDLPLLVSFAWSSHWKAYVDGRTTKTYNMEDLIFLTVPKGKHVVEVKYESIPIHFFANSISVLALLSIGFLAYRERRKTSLKETSA